MKFSTFNKDLENTFQNIVFSDYKFLLDVIFNLEYKEFLFEEKESSNLKITKPLLNLLQITSNGMVGYNQLKIKGLKSQQKSALYRLNPEFKNLLLRLRLIKQTFNHDLKSYFGLLVLKSEFDLATKLTVNNSTELFGFLDFLDYKITNESLIGSYVRLDLIDDLSQTVVSNYVSKVIRNNITDANPVSITIDDVKDAFLNFTTINDSEIINIINKTMLTDVLKITNVSDKFLLNLKQELDNTLLVSKFSEFLDTKYHYLITEKILSNISHLAKNNVIGEFINSGLFTVSNDSDNNISEENIRLTINNLFATKYKSDLENLEYICLQFYDDPEFFINSHYLVYFNYYIDFINNNLFELDFSSIFNKSDLQFVFNSINSNRNDVIDFVSDINTADIVTNAVIQSGTKQFIIPLLNEFFDSDYFLDYILNSIGVIHKKLRTYPDIVIDFDEGVELLKFRISTYIHTHDTTLNDLRYKIRDIFNKTSDNLVLSERDFNGLTNRTKTDNEITNDYEFIKTLYFSASLNLIVRQILSVYEL